MLSYVSKFISRGADVNHTSPSSSYGQTLLIQAINQNNHIVIRFLLDNGADPHIMDLAGKDACDYARSIAIGSQYPELNRCRSDLKR
jgi:ankyrin repeat protein